MLFFRRRDYSPVSVEEIERGRFGKMLGDRWWKVVYDDGREFYHGEISYKDIDRSRVREFHILGWTGETVFKIELNPARQTPIFRRRVKLGLGTGTGVTYVVGYVTKDGMARLYYISPDGKEVRPAYNGPVDGIDIILRGEEREFIQKEGGFVHT